MKLAMVLNKMPISILSPISSIIDAYAGIADKSENFVSKSVTDLKSDLPGDG
jgi:hypothetical protein